MKIKEHSYAEYYWLTLEGYDQEEWEAFKQQMGCFPKAYTYDGIDDEDHSVCFKFARHIPQSPTQIRVCKYKNAQIKKEVIKTIANNLRTRVYFNVRRGILKKLN